MLSRAERRNKERAEINLRARSAAVAEAKPRRVAKQTQLEMLYGRDAITLAQRNAGERLHKDYYLSGAQQRVTATMEPSLGNGGQATTERQVEAEERYRKAMQAVGMHLSPIVVAVCLLDEPAGDWAQNKGLPRPDGPARLRLALDLLREHYV